jgi:hypothetical protein
MRVLDLNQDGVAVSGGQFPDAEIDTVAFKDFYTWYSTNTLQYDVVVAGHVLQLVDRKYLKDFVIMLKSIVHDIGEIHIYVPDLEWVAKMLIANKPNPLIQFALYGNEQYPHRSGFTLLWLRRLCESAGIIVRHTTLSAFTIIANEESVMMPQLVVLGVRNDALYDPTTALD